MDEIKHQAGDPIDRVDPNDPIGKQGGQAKVVAGV